MNQLINPVNTKRTCSDKAYYYKILDDVFGWKSKINPLIYPLIIPVNTKVAYSDKTFYYYTWDSVQRGYKPTFIFIALILTEILAEIVKLTH